LVTEAELSEAQQQLLSNGLDSSDDAVSNLLVRTRIISEYQAEQLKEGRTKFTLGPYIITDWIGQGGMGQVFKARHEMMGREVAIKVLPQEKSSTDAIASFTREIRTQAQLDHPRLVRAYDAGQDGKVYFLVTEYVPGTDLRRLVRLDGRLTMVQAASIVSQVALGLQHAHEQQLIHRDIKPGNILVTPDGTAKLSDLGLAGFLHEGDRDPRAGKIVGTADYLSPEQIRDPGSVAPCSDIYSLGCTLYYAVTAKVPFPGGRTKDKVRRHLEEMPWHPRRLNPDIAEEFVDVVADMMEKDPVSHAARGRLLLCRVFMTPPSNTKTRKPAVPYLVHRAAQVSSYPKALIRFPPPRKTLALFEHQ
jgi:serine/threonine protein kinase